MGRGASRRWCCCLVGAVRLYRWCQGGDIDGGTWGGCGALALAPTALAPGYDCDAWCASCVRPPRCLAHHQPLTRGMTPYLMPPPSLPLPTRHMQPRCRVTRAAIYWPVLQHAAPVGNGVSSLLFLPIFHPARLRRPGVRPLRGALAAVPHPRPRGAAPRAAPRTDLRGVDEAGPGAGRHGAHSVRQRGRR